MPTVHNMAGRLSGASGIVTFCTCGLGFYQWTTHPPSDPINGRKALRKAGEEADMKWAEHVKDMNMG